MNNREEAASEIVEAQSPVGDGGTDATVAFLLRYKTHAEYAFEKCKQAATIAPCAQTIRSREHWRKVVSTIRWLLHHAAHEARRKVKEARDGTAKH